MIKSTYLIGSYLFAGNFDSKKELGAKIKFCDVPYNGGFLTPLFNVETQKWIEGYKATKIELINNSVIILNNLVSESMQFAKAVAMGKSINEDLTYFEEVYLLKYNDALDPNNSNDEMLLLEAIAEGFGDLKAYKELIINKYNQGQFFYKKVQSTLEVFRKIALQNINLENYDLVKIQVEEIKKTIDNQDPTVFLSSLTKIIKENNQVKAD